MMRLPALFLAAALLLSGCSPAAERPGGAAEPSATPAIAPVQSSTPAPSPSPSPTPSPTPESDPIREQLDALTTQQKVGQLLLAGIEGTQAGEDAAYALQTVQAGGVILFGRNVDTCAQVAELVSTLRALTGNHVPLLIAADEEGGPSPGCRRRSATCPPPIPLARRATRRCATNWARFWPSSAPP